MRDDRLECLTRSTVNARVTLFVSGPRPEVAHGPFDAVIRLFEHRLDDRTAIWYGVAEVACSFDDMSRIIGDAAGTPRCGNPPGYWPSFELADGRCGGAVLLNSEFVDVQEGEDAGSYCKLAFVGETTLAPKPARATA